MKKWSNIIIIPIYIFFWLHTTAFAEAVTSDGLTSTVSSDCTSSSGGCSSDSAECQKLCGCDGIYKFDDSKGECVIDYEYLKERTKSNNLMHTDHDVFDDDGLAKKIREDTERIFQGIMYCALFFVVCASVCVVSVCVFCCHIHYSDEKLRNEVKTLASKLKMDYHRRESIKKKPRDIKEESCNVIVEDANIMCV